MAQLRNVAEELASAVADGLGMTELPEPLPKALPRAPKPEVQSSEALSLLARPGRRASRPGASRSSLPTAWMARRRLAMHEALAAQGAVPRFVGVKLGQVQSASGEPIEVEISMETAPSVVWDAMIVPMAKRSAEALAGERPRARVPEGPVPALQADAAHGRARLPARREPASRRSCRRASRIRACCGSAATKRTTARAGVRRCAGEASSLRARNRSAAWSRTSTLRSEGNSKWNLHN